MDFHRPPAHQFFIPGAEYDVNALLGQSFRYRQTNSLAAAGDDGRFTLQPQIHGKSSRLCVVSLDYTTFCPILKRCVTDFHFDLPEDLE